MHPIACIRGMIVVMLRQAATTTHYRTESHLNKVLVRTLQPDCQALHNSIHIWYAVIGIVPLQDAQPTIEGTPAACSTQLYSVLMKQHWVVQKQPRSKAESICLLSESTPSHAFVDQDLKFVNCLMGGGILTEVLGAQARKLYSCH